MLECKNTLWKTKWDSVKREIKWEKWLLSVFQQCLIEFSRKYHIPDQEINLSALKCRWDGITDENKVHIKHSKYSHAQIYDREGNPQPIVPPHCPSSWWISFWILRVRKLCCRYNWWESDPNNAMDVRGQSGLICLHQHPRQNRLPI